jgi:hypothetical protein
MALSPFFLRSRTRFHSGTEGDGSRFQVLRARTHFQRYRGRRVPFSCFALPDSFSAVPSASGPVFMFCAPELIFDGTKGVRSCFHIFCSRTCFWRCGGCRVSFSWFVFPDTFSTVLRVSGPVFMFCAPGLVTECISSRFHVLRFRIHFWWYGGCRVPFSCFTRPESFPAVLRELGPIFILRPEHVFDGTEGVGSHFHVLPSQTHFRRCRVRRVTFSSFARPNSFSAVPRATGIVFMFCALGLVFGGTEGVWSCFHVLRARTHFRRYRGCRVQFSCFTLPESFPAVARVSGPVFMFCTPGLIFGVRRASGPIFLFCAPRAANESSRAELG